MNNTSIKNPSPILSLGEISWDRAWIVDSLPKDQRDYHILSQYEGPGGCALNTAMCLHAHQSSFYLVGNSLGLDLLGQKILDFLKVRVPADSYDINLLENLKTPFCQCLVAKDTGARAFLVEHSDIQKFDNRALEDVLQKTMYGEFNYAFVQVYIGELAKLFLEKTLTKPLWKMSQDILADHWAVPMLDCVQISHDEKENLSLLEIPAISKPYFRGKCENLLITHGAKGCFFHQRNQKPFFVAAEKCVPVDTTGCGDALRAGFLHGLNQGKTPQEALAIGAKWGAQKAAIKGSHLLGLALP